MKMQKIFFFIAWKMKRLMHIYASLRLQDTYHLIKPCDVLLICHDNDLGISIDGKAFSPLIDSMMALLNQSNISCERFALPFSVLTGEKAHGTPKTANRHLFLINSLTHLSKSLNTILRFFYVEKIIFSEAQFEENFYYELLKKTKCHCVMGIGLNEHICSASKKLGIFSVEILHGLGLPKIPFYMSNQFDKVLPGGILSFDRVSTNTFRDYNPLIEIKEMEHIWLKNFNIFLTQTPFFTTNKSYKKTILITLQWGYDNDHPMFLGILKNGIIDDALIEAIKLSKNEIFWHIRLHPVQLRNSSYKHHIRFIDKLSHTYSNCSWKEATFNSLPNILTQCDGHVSMISGSAYDAAYFGLSSLLLCPTLKSGNSHSNYFHDLIETKWVTLGIMNAYDILEWCLQTNKADRGYSLVDHSISQEELIKWIFSKTHGTKS